MGLVILYWTRFVVDYLEENSRLDRILMIMGNLIFLFQLISILVNFVRPVMFYFDAENINNSPLTDRFEIVTSETDPSNSEETTSETVTPGLIRDGDGEEDYDIPGDSIADPGEGSDPTNE